MPRLLDLITDGLVVERHRQLCTVEIDDGSYHKCRPIKRQLEPLVGDEVVCELHPQHEGMINSIAPRRTLLTRVDSRGRKHNTAANLSQLIAVVATEPALDRLVLDHYLVAAELANLKPLIVFNKTDLDSEAINQLTDYASIATVIASSAITGESAKQLSAACANERSVLVGQSGVGKSSLLNLLLGEQTQTTGVLSDKVKLGRHTTSSARLFRLPSGGELIDSPGVRQYAPFIEHENEVATGFKEFQPYIGNCRFDNCRHLAEPNCAIKSALATNDISSRRYDNFVRLYRVVEELRKKR